MSNAELKVQILDLEYRLKKNYDNDDNDEDNDDDDGTDDDNDGDDDVVDGRLDMVINFDILS